MTTNLCAKCVQEIRSGFSWSGSVVRVMTIEEVLSGIVKALKHCRDEASARGANIKLDQPANERLKKGEQVFFACYICWE